jgi:hypothetical protein
MYLPTFSLTQFVELWTKRTSACHKSMVLPLQKAQVRVVSIQYLWWKFDSRFFMQALLAA